jgi:hypothetical protein
MDDKLKDKYERQKSDFIDRKASGIERIFDKLFFAIRENVIATVLVISLGYNGYITNKYLDSTDSRVVESQEYAEKITEEVLRVISPRIRQEVSQETRKIENKVDDVGFTLDQIKQEIKKSIQENLK